MQSLNSHTKYPRVLIIGSPFNNKTGGGITMSNLFQGWPKDRLALASSANLLLEADTTICENYFQLGYKGKLHPFPLNIVLNKVNCGPVKLSKTIKPDSLKVLSNSGRYKRFYGILRFFLEFVGVFNILYKLKITKEYIKWIRDFNPDIIYSQLASFDSIRMVSTVARVLGKPVALHFMDDWISTINKPGLLFFYWKNRFENELLSLINISAVLMSIGEAMSIEYYKRYKRNFIPFHNPIDTNRWLPFSRKNWSFSGEFKILYAGRVGQGMKNSIIDVARVVNSLTHNYKDIVFEILSPDIDELKGKVYLNDNVVWIKPLQYSELPEKFSGSDLLILPIDFDEKSIKFLKYSFQTKISEYMISGTPILVYAPKETSTASYAIKDGWAYVVTERSDLSLENAILDLYSKYSIRKELGERAIQLAINKEDSDIVREKFRDCLAQKMN